MPTRHAVAVSLTALAALIDLAACGSASKAPEVSLTSVTLNATTATMDPGTARVFTAVVTEVADQSVTWSLSPTGAGTMADQGPSAVAYTAASTGGTVVLTATSVADPSAKGSVTITVRAAAAATIDLMNNWNIGGVDSTSAVPGADTQFEIAATRHLTYFDTYHYFNGGVLPGLLSLRHADGTVYGPWQSTGLPGQGDVMNAIWVCYPEVDLKPGVYTVVDSDPATWSFNDQSGGAGFAHLMALAPDI